MTRGKFFNTAIAVLILATLIQGCSKNATTGGSSSPLANLSSPKSLLQISGATSTGVTISWPAVSSAIGYNIYRNGDYLASVTGTSFTDTTATSGTQYCYSIQSYNSAHVLSSISAEVCSSPAEPTGVTAVATSATQITISWSPLSGANGYNIYRDGTYLASLSGTSYDDDGVSAGAQHCYTVQAYNSSGALSPMSAQACTSIPTSISVTITLAASLAAGNLINVSWENNPSGVAGFNLYRDGTYLRSTTDQSYSDGPFSTGTQHCYTVQAYDMYGDLSPMSAQACATLSSTPAPSPSPSPTSSTTTNPGQTSGPISGLPSWVSSSAAFTWQPKLGGVYWTMSLASVQQAAPYLAQYSHPVLTDIKSDATFFGYRFDLNSWDPQSSIHSDYAWDGTAAQTPASPEDVINIFGATGNAQFIMNIPIPMNLTSAGISADRSWGYDGQGYTWETPQYFAAMTQYLVGVAGPQSEWPTTKTLDFTQQPASFNWANLRAARGYPNPYPIVAFILGEEPYNLEGTPTGALYGPQAEKFRVAIRNRGVTTPLGLHVHDGGFVDTSSGAWFWPMMKNVTASDYSYFDLEHYYAFNSDLADYIRAEPVCVNPNAAYWIPTSQWPSDYTKFLWIVQDTRNAVRDDATVPGLGPSNVSRWQLGWSEHGVAGVTEFIDNDMAAAMEWAGWLAEAMRQNIAWDSAWELVAEGFSTAQIQVVNGDVTLTPMFYVYQMAQEFYGLNYLDNSYVSSMGSTTAGGGDWNGNTVQYPWTTVRTFVDPATGYIHLFVVNQSATNSATISGFEGWKVVGWKQLAGPNYSSGNALGVPMPSQEPFHTVTVSAPVSGVSLSIPPISINHIILSNP